MRNLFRKYRQRLSVKVIFIRVSRGCTVLHTVLITVHFCDLNYKDKDSIRKRNYSSCFYEGFVKLFPQPIFLKYILHTRLFRSTKAGLKGAILNKRMYIKYCRDFRQISIFFIDSLSICINKLFCV